MYILDRIKKCKTYTISNVLFAEFTFKIKYVIINVLIKLKVLFKVLLFTRIQARLLSEDYGKHLVGVEDLLQKHSLVEADINVLGERVKAVVQHSQKFVEEQEHGKHLVIMCNKILIFSSFKFLLFL